jgi:hypothetical protein
MLEEEVVVVGNCPGIGEVMFSLGVTGVVVVKCRINLEIRPEDSDNSVEGRIGCCGSGGPKGFSVRVDGLV